jgi:hypothetical protein
MCLNANGGARLGQHENGRPMKIGWTYLTSSGGIVIYRSPISEGRDVGFEYSCLEELSGSVSDPMIHEGEWPEQAARSWILPDCEHIKLLSVKIGGARTIATVVSCGSY